MKDIINELKQVFEFEREINETNIALDETQQTLTIKNIAILKILNIYKNKYRFNFSNTTFKVNILEILQKYNMDKIKFLDCIFLKENQFLIEENDQINFDIEFLNCKFNDNFSLFGLKIQNEISFENSTFKSEIKKININFEEIDFANNVIFKNTKFYGITKFLACNFEKDVDFSKTYFYDELIVSACEFKKYEKSCLNFTDSNFYNQVEFSDCKFYNDVKFINLENGQESNIDFNDFDISHSIFFANLDFTETKFYQNISFEKCQINEIKGLNKTYFYEQVGFENCKFNKNIDFSNSKFKNLFSLKECSFKSLANFEECTFEKDANFEKVIFYSHDIDYEGVVNQTRFTKATFMGKADFTKVSFNTRPSFSKTKFIKDAIFNSIQPSHHIYFKDSEFFENADFKNIEKLNHSYFDRVIFHKNVDFTNTNFIDYVSFTQASFKGSAYFNNAIFKNFINMSNCTIDDVVSFYDAKLYYTPYLSGANIDKNARFNLMYIKQNHKIDIEQAVDEYMENLKEDKEHIRKNKEYGKIEIAQGFRESFRILKSYLITNHNLLEASFYRVNELKAKELEMDLTKDKLSLSEKLEKRLFQLYKITSNHHSDLLLIVFTTLSVIGGYYLFSIAVESCFFGFNCDIINIINYGFYFLVSIVLCCIVFAFIECYFNIKICLYGIKRYVVFALIASSLCGIIQAPSIITPFIGVFSDNAKNYFLNKAIINLEDYQSISIANRLNPTAIYLNESQAKKDLLANKDIIKEDELILNAYNEALLKGKNADEFMSRINIIYYILMILCLFSLQKTARKNSIIPN